MNTTTTCLFRWPRNPLLTQWTQIQSEAYSISVGKDLWFGVHSRECGAGVSAQLQLLRLWKENFSIGNVKVLLERPSRCDIFTLWPTYDFMETSEPLPLLCFQNSVLYPQCVNSYCETEDVFFTFAPNTVKKRIFIGLKLFIMSDLNSSQIQWSVNVRSCLFMNVWKVQCQKNCNCFTERNFNLLS